MSPYFLRVLAGNTLLTLVIQLACLIFVLPLVWLLQYREQSFVDTFPPDVLGSIVVIAVVSSVLFGIWAAVGKARKK